jgi:hypothetical protein
VKYSEARDILEIPECFDSKRSSELCIFVILLQALSNNPLVIATGDVIAQNGPPKVGGVLTKFKSEKPIYSFSPCRESAPDLPIR